MISWEKEDANLSSLNFSYSPIFSKKSACEDTLFDVIFKLSNVLEFENYPMFAGAKWPFFWYNFL